MKKKIDNEQGIKYYYEKVDKTERNRKRRDNYAKKVKK